MTLDISHKELIEAARKKCPFPQLLENEALKIPSQRHQDWCEGFVYGCLHERATQRAKAKKK